MKKQILTNKEIEKDIETALKNTQDMSESSYKKMIIPIVLIAISMVVLEFVYPPGILWVLIGIVVFLLGAKIYKTCRLKYLIKNIKMEDYEVLTDTVSHIYSESYKVKSADKYRPSKTVNNYIIYFESRKSWKVPKENYMWSVERPMSDFSIYNSTHREDAYITVVKKSNGKIIVAYNCEFFEYSTK